MKMTLIRGVPLAMQRDGWWLDLPPQGRTPARQAGGEVPDYQSAGVLGALIALGDVLVWQVTPGLSLAVFAGALVTAALAVAGRGMSGRQMVTVLGVTILSVLPLVELVQPLSLVIAVAGVSVVLTMIAGLRIGELARGAWRLWPLGLAQTGRDAARMSRIGTPTGLAEAARQGLMRWAMPVTLGCVFVVLLLVANPVADGWIAKLEGVDVRLPSGNRALFWLMLVPVIWTALQVSALRERLRAAPRPARIGPARQGVFSAASVTRALILFNAVFAVQTGLDCLYLYGGAELPAGITYAEYAHRGAYPLLATALLAAGFALLCRRWVAGSAILRALLLVWVMQNVALTVSSLVRLELYVDVYGLTHLRLAAAIWMGLVAVGLALIAWQVWRQRDSGWLVLRGGGLSAAVLYGCSLVSFDAVVARHNLSQPVVLDPYHLCRLGDAAKPLIARYEMQRRQRLCYGGRSIQAPQDWREWGFRNWRARHSLSAIRKGAAR